MLDLEFWDFARRLNSLDHERVDLCLTQSSFGQFSFIYLFLKVRSGVGFPVFLIFIYGLSILFSPLIYIYSYGLFINNNQNLLVSAQVSCKKKLQFVFSF